MAAASGRAQRTSDIPSRPASDEKGPRFDAPTGTQAARLPSRLWAAYHACSAFTDRWLVRLIGCALAVVVAVMLIAVWTRYVQNDPVSWSEQLSRILFVWITFLGAAVLYRRGYHLAVTFFLGLLPTALQWWVRLINQLLLVGLFLVLLVHGFDLAWSNIGQTFGALDITPSSFYFAAPVSAALMLFYSLGQFAALAGDLPRRARRGEGAGR